MSPSPFYAPLKKNRLYEQVVEQIQQTIFEGTLAPGDRLPSERELAAQFQVGRPTVREALRTLSLLGLIEIRTGQKGSIVRAGDISQYVETLRVQLSWLIQADRETLKELWEVRKPIERGIAHAAARNATPEDIERLDGLLRKMEAAAGDIKTYFRLALQFHRDLALATRNRVYPLIWRLLDDILLQAYVPNLGRLFPAGPAKLLKGNQILLEAIRNGDPAGIDRALATHAEVENIFEGGSSGRPRAKKGQKR